MEITKVKIAIIGSSSTGKTTLAKELQKQRIVENYITVDARSIIEKYNIKNIDEFKKVDYILFQKEWLELKIKIENGYGDFITDRSYLDAIAYMQSKQFIDKNLIQLCHEKMKTYDVVFYLPYGGISFENDGFRSKNTKFNKLVDSHIIELLKSYTMPYYRINVSNLSERISFIKDIIEKDFHDK